MIAVGIVAYMAVMFLMAGTLIYVDEHANPGSRSVALVIVASTVWPAFLLVVIGYLVTTLAMKK